MAVSAPGSSLQDDTPDLPGPQRLESGSQCYREDINWLYTLYAARHLIFSRSKRLDEKVRSSLCKYGYPHEPHFLDSNPTISCLRVDVMLLKLDQVDALFLKLDQDWDGTLNMSEYRLYLESIGAWGKNQYKDHVYETEGWETECKNLQTTPERGVDQTAFRYLYSHRSIDQDVKTIAINMSCKVCHSRHPDTSLTSDLDKQNRDLLRKFLNP